MKKIKIIFAVLLISLLFGLTGCQKEVVVVEDKLETFLANYQKDNISYEMSSGSSILRVDGNKMWQSSIMGLGEVYYHLVGSTCYIYIKNGYGHWQKNVFFDIIDTTVDIKTFKKDDFILTNGAYLLKEDKESEYGVSFLHIQISPEMTGAIIKMRTTINGYDVVSDIKISRYGEVTITLPTINNPA